MDYRDRHVVITGGTGALGIAVTGALLQAGAVCHVPYRSEDEAARFPHREQRHVSLTALANLSAFQRVSISQFRSQFLAPDLSLRNPRIMRTSVGSHRFPRPRTHHSVDPAVIITGPR